MAVNTFFPSGITVGHPVFGQAQLPRYFFPAPPNFVGGRPVLGRVQLWRGMPVKLTAGAPYFSKPTLRPIFPFFQGQVELPNDRVAEDPDVWFLNRLKADEDGLVMEGIHSNYNDGLRFEVDGQSLVGRSDTDRGVAKKITVRSPLVLDDDQLLFNAEGIFERLAAIEDRLGALSGMVISNKQMQSVDFSISPGSNGYSVGPISIATGATITVPTGSRWVVI
jgi:hypothetical protein